MPYWHDDIGESFLALMQDVDALLLGRRTYVIHAEAFEPMPRGDPFGDVMKAPKKYVVSRTLEKPRWRATTIIRDNVIESVRALKAEPGRSILTDGSSQELILSINWCTDAYDPNPNSLTPPDLVREAERIKKRALPRGPAPLR